MTADDLEWPVLALAQLDADFTVVEPPELVASSGRGHRPRRFADGAVPEALQRLGEVAEAAQVGPPDALEHRPTGSFAEPAAHRRREHELLGPAELGETGAGGAQREAAACR